MLELPEAVIADLDGTIVDVTGIRHMINGPGSFHAFHMASVNCPVNQWVVDELREQAALGRAILVTTARQMRYRHVSAWTLALNSVPSDAMYMRRNNDCRPDEVIKAEILAKIRLRYWPVHAYDDRPEPCALWVREGIPLTVVPGWDPTLAG